MKKILFVLTTLGQGGAEQYSLRYMQYDCDNDFTVMATMGIGGVLEPDFRKVSKVVLEYKLGYLSFIKVLKVIKYLRAEHFDTVVDMHGSMSGFFMWMARRAAIDNRITFYRNTDPGFSPNWYRNIYAKIQYLLMAKYATKIFSNSKAALDKYHPEWTFNREKFKVIYNGLNIKTLSDKRKNEVRSSLSIPYDAFVIGHSGRASWQKNHKMILFCAERLCRKYKDIIFLLMGSGTDSKFADYVHTHGLDGKVRLLGNRKDVLDILKCLDLYYFPSISEGQPNALIEAMASGIPIVASNHESIIETVPETIRPNLVSPFDKESNLNLLERIYLDSEFRETQKCENWAKSNYDADKKFKELKDEL